jgi:hypothetical protein
LGIAVLAIALAFVTVRRQALKASEPVWSPPARRVSLAFLPALLAGFLLTLAACQIMARSRLTESMTLYASGLAAFVWLPALWIVLYGCAFHAAGFFLPRGMKLFGFLLLLGGCGLLWVDFSRPPTFLTGHLIMGVFFGGLHLAYGVYLYFTEEHSLRRES